MSQQRGYGSEQLKQWSGPPILELPDVDSSSGAFMDTAAIMQQLDLVISSDTSIVHLAGALARPTFLVLGVVPDWRWMLDRRDSPWYPSLRLFRQQRFGDWGEPFREIVAGVRQMLA